jgi:hypothetical protein
MPAHTILKIGDAPGVVTPVGLSATETVDETDEFEAFSIGLGKDPDDAAGAGREEVAGIA